MRQYEYEREAGGKREPGAEWCGWA